MYYSPMDLVDELATAPPARQTQEERLENHAPGDSNTQPENEEEQHKATPDDEQDQDQGPPLKQDKGHKENQHLTRGDMKTSEPDRAKEIDVPSTEQQNQAISVTGKDPSTDQPAYRQRAGD
jgi:hypothetical protein